MRLLSTMAEGGRPRVEIDCDQLSLLMELSFSWEQISALLGVSVSTVKQRAKENGFTKGYSTISETDLVEVIKEYLKQSSNAGQVLVQGHIAGLGLRVQRDRVRKAIHSINGSHPKQAAIFRRVYSVPGPNSLWHVDGNHKMIRWRLVIHGGIDGYSRLITYLQCSNNRSDTVLAAFVGACEVFGVPSRVRSDKGGENIDIWRSSWCAPSHVEHMANV